MTRAYKTVGLVCAGTVALGTSQITVAGLIITRRTRPIGLFATVAAVINIGLNLILIPAWGQVGAGVATVVGYLAMTGLYYHSSQRAYRTEYDLRRVIAIAVLGGGSFHADRADRHRIGTLLDVLIRLGGVVVLGLGLRVLGVIGPAELAEARGLIGRVPRGATPVSA